MTTNVEVVNNGKENSLSILRRFTKKVQKSGVLPRIRSIRYSSRNLSEYVQKKKALKMIRKREEMAKQIKLGRIPEVPVRGPRR